MSYTYQLTKTEMLLELGYWLGQIESLQEGREVVVYLHGRKSFTRKFADEEQPFATCSVDRAREYVRNPALITGTPHEVDAQSVR